jgi:hypothetical protein
MPRVKDSEELNDLNRAKKAINRNNMRNFKGADNAVVSGSTGKTTDLFEALVSKLIDLRASIYEVSFTIDKVILPPEQAERGRKKNLKIADVIPTFVEATARLIKQSTDIERFTVLKLKNNLNVFTEDQIGRIETEFSEVADQYAQLEENIKEAQISDRQDRALIGDELSALVENWDEPFQNWIEQFQQLLASYNKGSTLRPTLTPAEIEAELGAEGAGYSGGSRHFLDYGEEPMYKVGDQRLYAPRRYM